MPAHPSFLPAPPASGRFLLDPARCNACNLCVADCSQRVLEAGEGGRPRVAAGKEDACVGCQHCLAVCPTGAVSLDGIRPEDCLTLRPEALPTLDAMELLLRGRRSRRHFRPEPVDGALLDRLLDALENVPTGRNCQRLRFHVLRDPAVLARLREVVLKALLRASSEGRLPEASAHLGNIAALWFDKGVDIIFRGAPQLLIVSAPLDNATPGEDVSLALASFDLLAQSAGLATVWCGMLKRALEALPELKAAFGLPTEGVHYYPMLLGLPAVRHARAVRREGAMERVLIG